MNIFNFNLPTNWSIVDLPDLVFYQEGPGVRNNQYTSSGVKLLNVANLQEGKLVLDNTDRYISEEEAYGRYKHFLVDEGDLIVASSGIKVEYFDKKMGFVKKEHLPLCMNTSTIRFKSLDSSVLDIRYFMYFLKSNYFKKQLQRLITGSAQLNFGPSHLKQIKVILPDISTQKYIVALLDKSQDLIMKRKAQIEALDQLPLSVFYDMFGDSFTNENKFPIQPLSDIATVRSSKRVFVKEIVDEGIPFYRGTEIGSLAIGENISPTLFITEEHYNSLKEASGVPKIGDLLMPSICPDGRIWRVEDNNPFYFKDGRVLWVHFNNNDVNTTYVQYALKDKFIRDYLNIASGTTFAELKIFSLKKVELMMPPLDLQNKFASIVEKIEAKKKVMQKSLLKLEDNYNSILQKLLNGDLFTEEKVSSL